MFREPVDRKEGLRFLKVPCGLCLACRMAKGRSWAIRCQLELQSHSNACWCTLTYDDKHLPPTLSKSDLSGFLKRLRSRSAGPIRFFACGEYGERNYRPHYHSILFGDVSPDHVRGAWRAGFVRVDPLTPAAIAYVAGYCTKKAGQQRFYDREEMVSEDGEVFTWQEPFLLMSRRPGIGANARKYWQSWRSQAIWHGRPVPVPRYLHDAWKANATLEQREKLQAEVTALVATLDTSKERLQARAAILLSKHQLQAERRSL